MKIVIRTVVFHFVCILIFALFYYYFKDDFQPKLLDKDLNTVDYLLLSTTIQTGVGISDIYPVSFYGKIIMIIQQFLMIMRFFFLYFSQNCIV
jgi:hypothetical protein